MRSKTLATDLTSGSVTKQLIVFSLPFILSQLLHTLYSTVDMIVVGHFVGSAGLSAVSIGGDVMNVLNFLSMGFSNAGQIIISQYLGAGRRDKVKSLIGTLFSFLFICAVVMAIVVFFFLGNLLDALNTPPEAYDHAVSYSLTCICGIIFLYGYNIVSAILRGMGNSIQPFIFITIAAISNLVLDLILVAVFDLSVFGAALATVIGQAISFIWSLIYLYKKRDEFGFDFKLQSFKIDTEILKSLLKLGFPMAVQSASILFSRLVVNSWVNAYGVVLSAVTAIGGKVNIFASTISHSLSTAASSMIGQCIGAKKFDRVYKVIRVGLYVNLVLALATTVVVLAAPDFIFGLFTDDDAVLEACHLYIPAAVLALFSSGANSTFRPIINGSGNGRLNFYIAILDAFIGRIGIAYLLGNICGLGIQGFWYGHAAAMFMPFIIGLIFMLMGGWKKKQYIK